MMQEIILAASTIVAPAIGWLFYQVIAHKTAIEGIRETLVELKKGQDLLIEHLLNDSRPR